jgi:hypothetical protein
MMKSDRRKKRRCCEVGRFLSYGRVFLLGVGDGSTKEAMHSKIAAHTTQESATLNEGHGLKGAKPKSNFKKSTT